MVEFSDALIALRAALAELEQELGQALKQAIEHINELEALNAELVGALKHAAECKATPRKPLTDEEIWNTYKNLWMFHPAEEPRLAGDVLKFARAIERAHGIGEQHGS